MNIINHRKLMMVSILFLLLHNTISLSNTEKKDNVLNQIKKSIVFLGTVDEKGEKQFSATGFLVNIQEVYHLVTAKHVVMEQKDGKFTGKLRDDNLCVFFNKKDKRIGVRSIKKIKSEHGVDWIFHDNNEVDIAIIPFGLDTKSDDVKTIPGNLFLSTNKLAELYDVFFLSYQPGINKHEKKISPIIRGGIISLINDDKTFYIDGSAFPGNSGSPLFLKPSLRRAGERNIHFAKNPLDWKFVGIIGSYIPYQEVAISSQTKRPRVIFEENTGLSKVWSVDFIKKIEESKKFKKQINKVQSKPKKPKHPFFN